MTLFPGSNPVTVPPIVYLVAVQLTVAVTSLPAMVPAPFVTPQLWPAVTLCTVTL
jgi:hypothetical protein